MRRFWPASLLGQVLACTALALLAAQLVWAALLYRAVEERREGALLTAAAIRLANGGGGPLTAEGLGPARRPNGTRAFAAPMRLTVSLAPPIPIPAIPGEREETLRALLAREGVAPHRLAVTVRPAGEDPAIRAFIEARPRIAARPGWRRARVLTATMQRRPGADWETVRAVERRQARAGLAAIAVQTLVIFALVMALLTWQLRRITRPLAHLTRRVDDFSRRPDRAAQLAESGPADLRRLIAAHNAMEARIAAMLDEKDVMLGAIGHDLKTPLAALRVRIESVEDETQRARMVASIQDITRTLDDILALARIGKVAATRERTDLAALAADVVEEFEDLGELVTLAKHERLVVPVHVTWLRRALRNLVANALRYGGSARVSLVRQAAGGVVLRVEDSGPGIPAERIAAMLEPFARGEQSRGRATGGAGLGLALARAIAQEHGGELVLANREGGGLRAEIRLPAH